MNREDIPEAMETFRKQQRAEDWKALKKAFILLIPVLALVWFLSRFSL